MVWPPMFTDDQLETIGHVIFSSRHIDIPPSILKMNNIKHHVIDITASSTVAIRGGAMFSVTGSTLMLNTIIVSVAMPHSSLYRGMLEVIIDSCHYHHKLALLGPMIRIFNITDGEMQRCIDKVWPALGCQLLTAARMDVELAARTPKLNGFDDVQPQVDGIDHPRPVIDILEHDTIRDIRFDTSRELSESVLAGIRVALMGLHSLPDVHRYHHSHATYASCQSLCAVTHETVSTNAFMNAMQEFLVR